MRRGLQDGLGRLSLFTTYGNEDAQNFIADNTPDNSDRHKTSGSTQLTKFDTELARVIREDTDDGRSIARFLVNVMEGELRTFKPHHRMSAARDLLDLGFDRSAHSPNSPSPRPYRESKDPRPQALRGSFDCHRIKRVRSW